MPPPRSQDRFAVDLSAWCIQGLCPETAWDFHRSVLSAIVNRRRRLTPRGPEGNSRDAFLQKRLPAGSRPMLQHRLGAWHTHEAEL